MRKVHFILLMLIGLNAFAKQDTLKYRIHLTDKAMTTYALDRPEEFLSEKAVIRRMRQQLPIDSTDFPVCDVYVKAIQEQGVRIIVKGKWDNFVTVSCNDTTRIDRIIKLPFVKSAEKVWMKPKVDEKRKHLKRTPLVESLDRQEEPYGQAYSQIRLSRGEELHKAGYRGEGVIIAVIDAGYHNADRIPAFRNTHIVGTKDFVGESKSVYLESEHGLKVLSCIGADEPYQMIGTAPKASFWLLRTEDESSEQLVEQDYWAAAVEFADSVGVDLINTSLGYRAFDDQSKNYTYQQLDGEYALMSRQASQIANKGMILVCSAGNSGQGSWKKISPPADAKNVLAVGAVSENEVLSPFSSVGNTADNRIKPDVMAMGSYANVIGADGQPTTVSGTSFAAPILCGLVACLWQARPELTSKQIITLVRQSGDRAGFPDNIYGYGIPDMWKAYQVKGEIRESVF